MQAVPTEKPLTGHMVTTGEPLYEAACQFTRESYEKRLGCELEAFFPRIFVLSSEDEILGVCGIRAADKKRFSWNSTSTRLYSSTLKTPGGAR